MKKKTKLLPNILTFSRLVLTPLICWTLGSPNPKIQCLCFILFLLAAVSDFADGYIASQWDMRSRFGAMFDPLADKILVMGVFLFLVHTGKISRTAIWAIFLLFIREILILGLRQAFGPEKLSVLPLARWKTTVQMMSIGGFILPWTWTHCAANILLWLGVGLGFATLWAYGQKVWKKK